MRGPTIGGNQIELPLPSSLQAAEHDAFAVRRPVGAISDPRRKGELEWFTAVCAANDLLALGALQRLSELGIAVPGEVSVAGFDDIQTAVMATPRLSTVRLPLHDIGRRGFAFAERQLAGERPRRELLPTELVMRDSTAPPPPVALPRTASNRGATVGAA